jgi:flagellar hook-length control protein FliK
MSDMLAACVGAGGDAASKAINALAAGKDDASGLQTPKEGEGPFAAVLHSRLNPVVVGLPAQAADVAQALQDMKPVPGKDADAEQAAPLPPDLLALAMLNAQWPHAETAIQATQTAPAADASQSLVGEEAVALADTGLSGGMPVGREHAPATKPLSISVMSRVLSSQDGAAEIAGDGQPLPPQQGEAAFPSRSLQARSDGALPSLPTPGSVMQGLAAQFQAGVTEGAGVVAGQSGTLMAAGMGHGLPVMADMQGRHGATGVQLSIDVPVRSPMFPQELGERMVWLSSRQGQVADITLNPPHLGPLEVKLSLSGGEAGAQFFSPHAQVRDAIEAALPKLREMMAEAGVTLGQAQVRDESFSRHGSLTQAEVRAGPSEGNPDEQARHLGGAGGLGWGRLGHGLVDVFA